MNGEPTLFRNCVAASLALHFGFFFMLRFMPLRSGRLSPVEIDLTQPFLGTGPAKLGAPKRQAPVVAPAPAMPAESTKIPETVTAPQAPKEWVLSGPQTKTVEKPPEPAPTPGGTPTGSGTSPLPGGSGAGADYGSPTGTGTGGAPLVRLPQLLNRDEVLANLRRFYPENERRAGREGSVLVNIHIGMDGKVSLVDIVHSAGVSFDNAAKAVAFLMRFAPAENSRGPVPVKISQSMVFQLKDE